MTNAASSGWLLDQEARALLVRLTQVRPLALSETMVPAAALPAQAAVQIERFLHEGRVVLKAQVRDYLRWLEGPGRAAGPQEQQYRFVLLRLRFNQILSQFDTFSAVQTQRSDSRTGPWLAGLDVLASDALSVTPWVLDPPELVCYLARGPGAAIRRAKTRMPGGDPSPVAVIRIPRERMVGHGIASSLVHEVGHQAAALLGLVESLREEVARHRPVGGGGQRVWADLYSWISEIVADLYSVATLGISSTLGLLAVVSLPRYFVFRPSDGDPHPTPYLRVLLSCAIGDELYPHPQWADMADTWRGMYPVDGLPQSRQAELRAVEEQVGPFTRLLVEHRSDALHGHSLRESFPLAERRPERLLATFDGWAGDLGAMARQPPSLVFAATGQGRVAGRITPAQESRLLSTLLEAWALRSRLDTDQRSARPRTRPLRRVA